MIMLAPRKNIGENIMSEKKELTPDEFNEKWQEELDKITNERNIGKITLVPLSEDELIQGKTPNSASTNVQLNDNFIEEARARMYEKYLLVTEENQIIKATGIDIASFSGSDKLKPKKPR